MDKRKTDKKEDKDKGQHDGLMALSCHRHNDETKITVYPHCPSEPQVVRIL